MHGFPPGCLFHLPGIRRFPVLSSLPNPVTHFGRNWRSRASLWKSFNKSTFPTTLLYKLYKSSSRIDYVTIIISYVIIWGSIDLPASYWPMSTLFLLLHCVIIYCLLKKVSPRYTFYPPRPSMAFLLYLFFWRNFKRTHSNFWKSCEGWWLDSIPFI